MTKDDEAPVGGPNSGETRERNRRRNFWIMILLFAGFGIVLGLAFALIDGRSAGAAAQFAAIALLVGANAAFLIGSVVFFRKVDELELADNLWGSLIGFYFFSTAVPTWWILHEAGLAPPIDIWLLYFATLAAGVLAYLVRKARNR